MKVNLQGQVQPTLQGSRWACGLQVVKAGAKDLFTLTCGVGMNARGAECLCAGCGREGYLFPTHPSPFKLVYMSFLLIVFIACFFCFLHPFGV